MSKIFVILTLILFMPLAGRAEDRAAGERLMAEGKWAQAVAVFERLSKMNASDGRSRLLWGVSLFRMGDVVGADEALREALDSDPSLLPQVAGAWQEEGARAIASGSLERGQAMYSKAVALDGTLGRELGLELLAAADKEQDETRRARIARGTVAWVGPEEVALQTADYFSRKLGPARQTRLDVPGWVELVASLRAGDMVYYLATEPFRERDGSMVRVMPQALELPVRLVFEEKDMGREGRTSVRISKLSSPVRAWFWILPGMAGK